MVWTTFKDLPPLSESGQVRKALVPACQGVPILKTFLNQWNHHSLGAVGELKGLELSGEFLFQSGEGANCCLLVKTSTIVVFFQCVKYNKDLLHGLDLLLLLLHEVRHLFSLSLQHLDFITMVSKFPISSNDILLAHVHEQVKVVKQLRQLKVGLPLLLQGGQRCGDISLLARSLLTSDRAVPGHHPLLPSCHVDNFHLQRQT